MSAHHGIICESCLEVDRSALGKRQLDCNSDSARARATKCTKNEIKEWCSTLSHSDPSNQLAIRLRVGEMSQFLCVDLPQYHMCFASNRKHFALDSLKRA